MNEYQIWRANGTFAGDAVLDQLEIEAWKQGTRYKRKYAVTWTVDDGVAMFESAERIDQDEAVLVDVLHELVLLTADYLKSFPIELTLEPGLDLRETRFELDTTGKSTRDWTGVDEPTVIVFDDIRGALETTENIRP